MDITFTRWRWLNYLFLAFLLGFGWACGTWFFGVILVLISRVL